ncbi:hypothetical protein ABZ721_34080 [Streptomyces sp. NPDC006733]|uniref:hypothetical protein n=1 Tax=Streptomyces sp. NPDC006733 TaxID=3155460 RepID=UPI0034017C04
MTLHLTDLGGSILMIGCAVGYLVHRHSRTAPGATASGDVVGAIGSAVAVITALLLLFGGGSETAQKSPLPGPTPSQSPR